MFLHHSTVPLSRALQQQLRDNAAPAIGDELEQFFESLSRQQETLHEICQTISKVLFR
jgi:hypothetical protein